MRGKSKGTDETPQKSTYTDRNFVDKCSQQVMHFDHEATY